MVDDAFRRHLDDYAAIGRDGAMPPMVHEIYRRGHRHQRLQRLTWSSIGLITLGATFLAGMVVRDQTTPAIAGTALPTTSTTLPATSTTLGLGFGVTTLTTVDPFGTPTFTTSQFTTTSFTTYTTVTSPTTPLSPTTSMFAPPLEAGVHQVDLTDISGSSVTFDKVQFFTGSAARSEAARDGEQPTNGIYIRNVNPARRTFQVASGARIRATRDTMGRSGTPSQLVAVSLSDLAAEIPTTSETIFDITVDGSRRITAITERWLG